MSAIERFLSKVARRPGRCWLWLASRVPNGYGQMFFAGRRWSAHRLSWRLLKGEDPGERCVLHRCDTPSCVNPDHLFLGTAADNAQDMQRKGRSTFGERHGMAKLNSDEAREAYALHRSGWSNPEIAARLGVSRAAVRAIVTGRSWRHLALLGGQS